MFNVPSLITHHSALLLPLTSSWGWGTWARAWKTFDQSALGAQQIAADKELRRRFNMGGAYDYATMLRRQITDDPADWDWDIRWYLSVFMANGLTVFPPRSLVRNIGQDGSGVHGGGLWRSFAGGDVTGEMGPIHFPRPASPAPDEVRAAVEHAIWRQNGAWIGRVTDIAKRLLRK